MVVDHQTNCMSFTNKSSNTFFTIFGGKFTQRVQEGTPDAKERVNKLGKTVYELFHDTFNGKLIDIRTTESPDYGKSWNFDFLGDGDGKIYTLQLSYSNSFATALLKMLPNINLEESIALTPSQKVIDGKTQSTIFANQKGVTIKHAYTKDAPNGLPPMKEIVVKGQKVWDDTDRIEFLHAMVQKDILPKLRNGNVSHESVMIGENADHLDISPDDLPEEFGGKSALEKEFDSLPSASSTPGVDEVDY